MFDRFRWWFYVISLFSLHIVSPPLAANATVEERVLSAESESISPKGLELANSSSQNRTAQTNDRVQGLLPQQKANSLSQAPIGFSLPERQTLVELIGMSEIPVLADIDGQFVQNLVENQIFEEEFARKRSRSNLSEAIHAGRNFNRESLAALATTEQAKAQARQALSLLLPSVSVRVNRGHETSEPSVQLDETTGEPLASDKHLRTDASLTVRQPLFNLPSFLDWRRRKVIQQARMESYRVSDGDAYISTVNAYLSLVASRLQTDMTRDFEEQLAELLSYIEKRANAGASSIADMARVRARRQATLSSRLEQEAAHAAAGIEFIRLTNQAPQSLRLPVPEEIGALLLPKSLAATVATAIEFNPEIAALTAEVQAAKIDQSATKGRFLPRIDAEYTDTYTLHAGGDPSPDGQRDKRLMLVMNWNLFSGGGDINQHIERTARHKELRYRLDDQRRRVIQALIANYSTLSTTSERIASGYQELQSISTAAEAMSKRMLSGNQSLLDLLDVYDRHHQVRSRLVSLHILEMNTAAQLIRLTIGTPWATSPAEQNQDQPLAIETALHEGE